MRVLLVCFSLFLMSSSCEKQNIASLDVMEINSGKRFGFCMGYCSTSVTLTPSLTIFRSTPTRHSELSEIICTTATQSNRWQEVVNTIDDAFFALDTVIGCPDCVDQGAEFVEVRTATQQHSIRFDPGLGQDIHPIVSVLRDLRAEVTVDSSCTE
jgi:hypothetical protein